MKEETFRIVPAKPRKLDIFAGILSYLVPGLGQYWQGRTAKGILFFVCLEGLFFYGLWLGQWQNVYVTSKESSNPVIGPRAPRVPRAPIVGGLIASLTRPHFVGQFFIGISAWPAIYQYRNYDENQDEGPLFGKFEREPSDEKLNEMQRNDNKVFDLAWVYTVIAGVLNILVIYDAVAGAAFTVVPFDRKSAAETQAAAKAGETVATSPPPPQSNKLPVAPNGPQPAAPLAIPIEIKREKN